jgi:hypothetical protein
MSDRVWIMWSLADVAGRKPGEAGAVGQEVVEVVGRHELRAWLSMHVDELREQELDAVVFHDPPDIVGVLGGVCHGPIYIPRGGRSAMAQSPPTETASMFTAHIGRARRSVDVCRRT